jgi:predicted nucleotidyltransferase
MLVAPLDRILSTPTKVRVLRALFPLGRGISGREVARLAGVSRAVMGALDELVDLGVVTRHEATGQHLYALNRGNYLAASLQELFQSEERRVEAIYADIRVGLRGSDTAPDAGGVLSAAVFGSAARGEAGPGSDFDLLVVTASPGDVEPAYEALPDLAERLRERFGLRLSPVVLPVEQVRSRHLAGDLFIAAAVRDAIPVLGPAPCELLHDAEREANA